MWLEPVHRHVSKRLLTILIYLHEFNLLHESQTVGAKARNHI